MLQDAAEIPNEGGGSRRFLFSILLGWAFLLPLCGHAATPAPTEYLEKPGEGQELVKELLSRVPKESHEFSGTLQIHSADGPRRDVPFKMALRVGPMGWQDIYESAATQMVASQLLIIEHTENKPNRYLFAVKTNESPAAPKPISAAELYQPFASSDFWLCDLGLEFLHWPKHRIVKKEMRKGRSCRVLESLNPRTVPQGYRRVLSWIDYETGDLVRAEGYDAENKLLKEFSIKSIKKVDGRWQLKRMDITNEKTDSRTALEYDLDLDK